VEFTEPVVLVLTSLAEGPKHGYALAKDIEAFAGIKLGPGTLYGALSRLRGSGLAILLIEQNAHLAFEFCGRGYVLQHGRVALKGSVDELRSADLVRRIYLGSEAIAA